MNRSLIHQSALGWYVCGYNESLVKSVKRCLKVIIRESKITKKTLLKLIWEDESILNQKPILPMSNEIKDFETLAPNNFLIARDSISWVNSSRMEFFTNS